MIYLGVVSSFLLNIILFTLIRRVKPFSLKSYTFSDLALFKETAILLNATLIVIAIARMVYFSTFIHKFYLTQNYLIIVIIYLSLASMFLAGLIPVTTNKIIHQLLGYVTLVSSITILLFFHFFFNPIGSVIVISIGKILALTMIGGTLFLRLMYKNWGRAEAFSIFMIFVWDVYILLSFLLR